MLRLQVIHARLNEARHELLVAAHICCAVHLQEEHQLYLTDETLCCPAERLVGQLSELLMPTLAAVRCGLLLLQARPHRVHGCI